MSSAGHSVAIHREVSVVTQLGKELALVCGCCSGGCACHAQSPSHAMAWDVFSSAGHFNCAVVGI